MRWRLYYDDGSTYDGPPEGAPARGVQVVAYEDPNHGRQVTHTCDFYWWVEAEEVWYGGDIFGLWDHLAAPGWKRVLFGRTIPTEQYRALVRRAMEEVI